MKKRHLLLRELLQWSRQGERPPISSVTDLPGNYRWPDIPQLPDPSRSSYETRANSRPRITKFAREVDPQCIQGNGGPHQPPHTQLQYNRTFLEGSYTHVPMRTVVLSRDNGWWPPIVEAHSPNRSPQLFDRLTSYNSISLTSVPTHKDERMGTSSCIGRWRSSIADLQDSSMHPSDGYMQLCDSEIGLKPLKIMIRLQVCISYIFKRVLY